MNKEGFLDLVWRIEEIMMHRDYLQQQIGSCGGRCQGFNEPEDKGMCPDCCDAFVKLMEGR